MHVSMVLVYAYNGMGIYIYIIHIIIINYICVHKCIFGWL